MIHRQFRFYRIDFALAVWHPPSKSWKRKRKRNVSATPPQMIFGHRAVRWRVTRIYDVILGPVFFHGATKTNFKNSANDVERFIMAAKCKPKLRKFLAAVLVKYWASIVFHGHGPRPVNKVNSCHLFICTCDSFSERPGARYGWHGCKRRWVVR